MYNRYTFTKVNVLHLIGMCYREDTNYPLYNTTYNNFSYTNKSVY